MQNQHFISGSNKEKVTVVNQNSSYTTQKTHTSNDTFPSIENIGASGMILIFGALVIGVLHVILFFKIWNATDNIKKMLNIAEKYEKNQQKELLQ